MSNLNGKEVNGSVGWLIADRVNKLFIPIAGATLCSLLVACQGTTVVSAPATADKEQVREKDQVADAVAEEASPCELPSFDGGRKYVVEAWAVPDSMFDVGEPLRLQMRASAPSHMSVFYVSTSCKVTRLLNNYPLQAAQIVDFPIAASGLRLTVKPPAGDEAFYFVATRGRLDFLSNADILGDAAGIANLDLSPAQFYERLADARSRINPDDWSAMTLRTSVVGH